MAKQAAARIVCRERHAADAAAEDAVHSVVLRQTLVHEGEVGVEQIDDRPILAHNGAEEELGLLLERSAEVLVKVRRIRPHVLQLTQEQPLAGEVADQRVSARVSEQTANLAL